MKHRRDAFHEGVLSDDVIPLTAALAAQEHGDARKAIEILRHAGELAERENVDTVVEEHVRDAQEWAEIDRFEELLRGSTMQVKFILYSLALLTEENPNEDGFSTNRIYERYRATTEKADAKTLSEHRVYDTSERGWCPDISFYTYYHRPGLRDETTETRVYSP